MIGGFSMRTKVSNVLWGLFFIIIGVGFAGNAFDLWHFNLFFSGWWTLFIIVPCGISLFQNGYRTGTLIGFVIGLLLFFSANGIVPSYIIGKLFVPIILILIGVSIMFRNNFRKAWSKEEWQEPKTGALDYAATFSGQKIEYNNELFLGANLNAIFGGVELRLERAIINENVSISCSAIFGGIDIYVPSDVNVKVMNTSIFGGVDNKVGKRAFIQDAPTIYINATCMFGGVDIK